MKVVLKTKKSSFCKIHAQYRVIEAMRSVLTAGVEASTVLANSMILAILPTTADLESQVGEERLLGTDKNSNSFEIFLFPFPFLKYSTLFFIVLKGELIKKEN